jgi:hypothetical protein
VKGYTISFAFTLLMESSSILLAGGRLFPFLRRDLLFGVLFFAFRIVYHAYLLWKVRTYFVHTYTFFADHTVPTLGTTRTLASSSYLTCPSTTNTNPQQIYSVPNPRVIMWPPVLGVLVLHLYWFYGWIEQQRRRQRRAKAGEPMTPSSLANPAFVGNGSGGGKNGGTRNKKE